MLSMNTKDDGDKNEGFLQNITMNDFDLTSLPINDRVQLTKNALMAALGDKQQNYLDLMKKWFKNKSTKDEFDFECRKLLSFDKVRLHNDFLMAILIKLEMFENTPRDILQPAMQEDYENRSLSTYNSGKKRKRYTARNAVMEREQFSPYSMIEQLAEERKINGISLPPAQLTGLLPQHRYCSHELFLPDSGFIVGRLLVMAWENGLSTADDSVAEYIALAVRTYLKNILSEIVLKHKHYKVGCEGTTYYDIGTPIKSLLLRNTVTRNKIDDGPLELDKEITSPNFTRRANDDGVFLSACEDVAPTGSYRITLEHLKRALKNRNIIGSHSSYILNTERITSMME